MVRESDNHAANDSVRRCFAAGVCVEPIVECIRKMQVDGLADNEIVGLLRHAADGLDAAQRTTGKFEAPLKRSCLSNGSGSFTMLAAIRASRPAKSGRHELALPSQVCRNELAKDTGGNDGRATRAARRFCG